MDKHFGEGYFAHVLESAEYHTRHPEEDDVVCGNEHVGGIEVFEVLRGFGITERGEGPERGAEPGVEYVLVLLELRASAMRATGGIFLLHYYFAAIFAVPRGDTVSPPELTGNAPVFDILHPVEICLGESLRNEPYLTLAHHFYRGGGELLHTDEPLFAHDRFDGALATVTTTHVVRIRLDLLHEPLRFEILDDFLAGSVSVHSRIGVSVLVDDAAVVHYAYNFEIMS